jgi:hypothetical protein
MDGMQSVKNAVLISRVQTVLHYRDNYLGIYLAQCSVLFVRTLFVRRRMKPTAVAAISRLM